MRMVNWRNKRSRGLLAAVGLAAIALVLWASRTNEPSFQGQVLSEWLAVLERAQFDGEVGPAESAIHQIGTNAIPFLLGMMRAEDSKLKKAIITVLAKQRIFRIRIPDSDEKQLRAMLGFQTLGPQASSAIPELKRLVNNPKTVSVAASALANISPDGVQAAASGLQSTNATVRRETAGVLGLLGLVRFSTNASLARLDLLRAGADRAVPPLIRALNDSDELTRARAATSLGLLGQKPEIAVPALIHNLQETNGWRVPASAAKGLGRFGTNAAPALPALKAITGHQDSRVREAVAGAIRAIESSAEPRLE